ncbi:MAG: ExeA family protein [Candidatus Odinarchaeia archaeon]
MMWERDAFTGKIKDLEIARKKYYELLGWQKDVFQDAELPAGEIYVDNNEECIIQIAQALNGQKSQIVLIYGDAGIGKSCFRREMKKEIENDPVLGKKFKIIKVDDPGKYTDLQVLRLIGDSLEIDFGSKWNNREGVVSLILERLYNDFVSKKIQTIILVDEAQKLSTVSLDTLKQFSDLEYQGIKLCRIILLATPDIFRKFTHPSMDPFIDRILIKFELKGFNFKETAEYIARWIAWAKNEPFRGIDGSAIFPFTPDAIEKIHQFSKGHPRTIRKLCALCVDVRIENPGKIEIDNEIVEKAIERLI